MPDMVLFFFLLRPGKVHLKLRLTLPNDSRRRIRAPQEATNLHCLGLFLPKRSCENINDVLVGFLPYILWLLSSRSITVQEAGRSGRLRFYNPNPVKETPTCLSMAPPLRRRTRPHTRPPPTLLKVTDLRRKYLTVDSNQRLHLSNFKFSGRESLCCTAAGTYGRHSLATLSLALLLSLQLFFFIPSAQLV